MLVSLTLVFVRGLLPSGSLALVVLSPMPPTPLGWPASSSLKGVSLVNLAVDRVLVLGDAFYRNAPFSRPVDSLPDLGEALRRVLDGEDPAPPRDRTLGYFAALWGETHPGELYVTDPGNIARFTASKFSSRMATRGASCISERS